MHFFSLSASNWQPCSVACELAAHTNALRSRRDSTVSGSPVLIAGADDSEQSPCKLWCPHAALRHGGEVCAPGRPQGMFMPQMYPSLAPHLWFHTAKQNHNNKNFNSMGKLVGEGIQTTDSYPGKYVAYFWRELSHEVSNFCWKFLLDITTMVWIYTSFITDIHSSSTDIFSSRIAFSK